MNEKLCPKCQQSGIEITDPSKDYQHVYKCMNLHCFSSGLVWFGADLTGTATAGNKPRAVGPVITCVGCHMTCVDLTQPHESAYRYTCANKLCDFYESEWTGEETPWARSAASRPTPRHAMSLSFTSRLVLLMLGLPQTATLTDLEFDHVRQMVIVTVEHPDLPYVPEGAKPTTEGTTEYYSKLQPGYYRTLRALINQMQLGDPTHVRR